MKKMLYFALAGLALLACKKEVIAPVVVEDKAEESGSYTFTINASVTDDLTKTAYAGEKTFSWSANDEIDVVFHKTDGLVVGDDIIFCTLKTTAGGTTAAFSGTVPNGYAIGASSNEGGMKWAFYPAGDHVWDYTNHRPKYNIPEVTDFTTADHVSANIPMAAVSSNGTSYSFYHIACPYKISFSNVDATKVRFTVTHSATHKMSGIFSIENSSSDAGLWADYADAGAANQSVSYIKNVTSKSVDFYFSIPRYGESSGFQPTITLIDEATGYILYKKTAKANWTAEATLSPLYNRIVALPAIPAPGAGKPIISAFLGDSFNWADVDMNPSTPAIKDSFSGDGAGRILDWKAYSDATNIYFFYRMDAALAKSRGKYSEYILTGFDTAEGGETDSSYGGLGDGLEARSLTYPLKNDAGSAVTFYSPSSPCSENTIIYPINKTSVGKATTNGALGGAYVFVEICIPRNKIGSPANGTIRVVHACASAVCASQNITLTD